MWGPFSAGISPRGLFRFLVQIQHRWRLLRFLWRQLRIHEITILLFWIQIFINLGLLSNLAMDPSINPRLLFTIWVIVIYWLHVRNYLQPVAVTQGSTLGSVWMMRVIRSWSIIKAELLIDEKLDDKWFWYSASAMAILNEPFKSKENK